MPSVIANLKVKQDKIEEAKTFLTQLAKESLANESGTLVYTVHQRKDDPASFVFYEKYESEEAFNIHGKNLASKGAGFAGILAGPPEIILIEEV
ncbi:MAG: antibiotic biosynthesis monooxygenase [Deltaproteobacteria bacterium]|nr:antibiotic biosynthesis monooxygenase [Deltaproteobacteria bacterium]MBW2391101.1 antibiotic biosynthesis monooxygenase [Deltaproteobacteria bacterium]MBW2724135.1 antibiotic biosynthesis monooxygenase [Deltaproteobacteria bacterium]